MSSSSGMIRKLETSFNSMTTHKACPTAFKRSWTKEVIHYFILSWKQGRPVAIERESLLKTSQGTKIG